MAFKGLGYNVERERLNKIAADAAPQQEVLGTIPYDQPEMDITPQGPQSSWVGPTGDSMAIDEGPPPWELEDYSQSMSDARRYVDVPQPWTLRWINPRLLEAEGWRDWRHVDPADTRVKLKVAQMRCADGTIRRGGPTGDILAYMPTHWVESRRRQFAERTARQTASAIDKQRSLQEEFKRGSFGPYLHLDAVKHPTHTAVEGASLRD